MWLFSFYKPHIYQVTNVALSLEDVHFVDLVETCVFCGKMVATPTTRDTLSEALELFPHAFSAKAKDRIEVLLGIKGRL
jgi:hypothetical protein